MITKDALDQRIAELDIERVREVIRTDATYNGAIQELKRLRSLFEDQNKTKEK